MWHCCCSFKVSCYYDYRGRFATTCTEYHSNLIADLKLCSVYIINSYITELFRKVFHIFISARTRSKKLVFGFSFIILTFCRKQDKFSTFIWKRFCRAAIEVSGTMTLESDRYLMMVTFKDRNSHIYRSFQLSESLCSDSYAKKHRDSDGPHI